MKIDLGKYQDLLDLEDNLNEEITKKENKEKQKTVMNKNTKRMVK
jgi:hypothetical protein